MTVVFCGRFQPFHNEHYQIVKTALAKYDRLVIGVIINSVDRQGKKCNSATSTVEMGNARQEPCSNPLTVIERVAMINKLVDNLDLRERIVVTALPRPTLYWELVETLLPAPRVWILGSASDEFERAKMDLFRSNGDRVDAVGSSQSTSGTVVRALLRNQDPVAADYLPSLIYEELKHYAHVRW